MNPFLNDHKQIGLFFMMLAISGFINAQITFKLENLPKQTPEKDIFYLAGTFNNWDASSSTYQFQKAEDGYHYVTLNSFRQDWIGYLITRGSWETVEVDVLGVPKLTRKLSNVKSKKDTIVLDVDKWADLHLKNPICTVKLVLDEIPKNTPPDAPIYVTGNFNGWAPGDKRFQMKELKNGKWTTEVPLYWSKLEYKYSRGNWQTVEGKAYGRPRLDRVSYLDLASPPPKINDSVTHWEDLSSRNFNPYTIILILAAIQGFILILIINSYENNNKKANTYLSILMAIISIALLFRVAIYDREVYQFSPRMSLLPDLVYFLYAPILLIYVRKLLNTDNEKRSPSWLHFVPFLLQLLSYIVFFFEPIHIFIVRSLTTIYARPLYIVIGGLALCYNVWYWYKIKNIISKYLKGVEHTFSADQNIVYLRNIMNLKGVCLSIWILTYLIGGIGLLIGFNLTRVTIIMVDLTWVVFSLTVYLLGYFAIKQPEIFKLDNIQQETPKIKLSSGEIVGLTSKLKHAMEEEKLYLNASLTLPELSQKLDSSLHEISRAINEGFQKNFRDFINHYRVQEFIKRADEEAIKKQTFLALAMEVGFNSKSSFNRSFRKITGKSPREYFRE